MSGTVTIYPMWVVLDRRVRALLGRGSEISMHDHTDDELGDKTGDSPPAERQPQRGRDNFDLWTRRPVAYLPVTRRGKVIGYLWGSVGGNAASFFPDLTADLDDRLKLSRYWKTRLAEARQLGLSPTDAIKLWIGKPEDSECGGIAPHTNHQEAQSIQELALRLNPDKPLGNGPWIQDGAHPDGTPVGDTDRWGPLVSKPPAASYPTKTSSAVVYFPITRRQAVLGYLWASVTGEAAGYLPRTAAGDAGIVAGGLWRTRLRDAYAAGMPSLDAVRRCQTASAYVYDQFGLIGESAEERTADDLAALEQLAAE